MNDPPWFWRSHPGLGRLLNHQPKAGKKAKNEQESKKTKDFHHRHQGVGGKDRQLRQRMFPWLSVLLRRVERVRPAQEDAASSMDHGDNPGS